MDNFSTKHGGIMHNEDGNWQRNADDTWSQAIPLPFYGLKKQCQCGKSFWKEESYRKHYREIHTDGKKYQRTLTGLKEI